MPAPPSTKQKAANQASMTKTKSKSTAGSNPTTKTGAGYKSPTTNGGTNSGSKSKIAGGTMSGVKNSAVGYTKNAGNTMSGVRSGVTTKVGGGLLGGGGGSTLGNPSQLMQKAMDRSKANLLGQQYSQYRSPQEPREDLTSNAFLANKYSGYRNPTNPAVNQMAPQSREQMDARINAISRGPGSVAGVMPGASPLSQQRTLQTLSGGLQGAGIPLGPQDTKRLSQTIAGESANQPPMGQTAVGNTMLNRMALAGQDPNKFGYMGGGDINSLMGQYDATGMRPGTSPNSAFRGAQLGTDTLGEGMASLAGAASQNSQFNTTQPDNIRNATHFITPAAQLAQSRRPQGPTNWSNNPNQPFGQIGGHLFGNAENIGQQVADARGMPSQPTGSTPTMMASASPTAAPPTPQQSIAPAQTQGETAPSFWQSIGDAGQAAYNAVDQNLIQPTQEQVAKYGGFERAGKLAQMAVGIMKFMPGTGAGVNIRQDQRDRIGGAGDILSNGNQQAQAGQLGKVPGKNGLVTPKPPTTPAAPPVNQAARWMYPQYTQLWNPTLAKYSGQVG